METVRSSLEVADILRASLDNYRRRQRLSPEQATVVRHLLTCRTAALGGHRDHCAACGYVRISYNSCRDRHCPKCQGAQRAAWLESRRTCKCAGARARHEAVITHLTCFSIRVKPPPQGQGGPND